MVSVCPRALLLKNEPAHRHSTGIVWDLIRNVHSNALPTSDWIGVSEGEPQDPGFQQTLHSGVSKVLEMWRPCPRETPDVATLFAHSDMELNSDDE